MTPRARVMMSAILLACGASSCGQQGPLVLPEGARPIEPVEPPASESQQNAGEEQDER